MAYKYVNKETKEAVNSYGLKVKDGDVVEAPNDWIASKMDSSPHWEKTKEPPKKLKVVKKKAKVA